MCSDSLLTTLPTSSAVLSRNLDLRGTFENGNILENTSTWTNWDTRAVQNVSRCFANISSNSEVIKTLSVKEWKKDRPKLNKKPSIFILGND